MIVALNFLWACFLFSSYGTISVDSSTLSGSLSHYFGTRKREACGRHYIKDNLQSKSKDSDVILTGTVMKVKPERGYRHHQSNSNSHEPSASNWTAVGRIEVWRVVKGSLDEGFDLRKRNKKRSSGHALNYLDQLHLARKAPLMEVHGLWNSQLCGSFVEEGDTRVFFLKKVKDHRGGRKKHRRRKKHLRERKRAKKSSKKRETERKSRKGNTDRRRREESKSVRTEWVKIISGSKIKQSMKRKRVKKSSSPESLLLLSSDPARITLSTLDEVEKFAKLLR